MRSTATWRNRSGTERLSRRAWLPVAAAAVALLVLPPVEPQELPPEEPLAVVLENGLDFLRRAQNQDGSFGSVQPHLQTSVAILAFLCVENPPGPETLSAIEKAVDYLERTSSASGDLGDDAFRTESHALGTTALTCALEQVRTPELRLRAAGKLQRALRLTQQMQDRSSASPSRGGWKMEGFQGDINDRRASAWALLSYLTALQYGIEVKPPFAERGVAFLMGSFKEQAEEADQVGGFSVDTEGLAVASISSMGGWAMSRFGGKEEHRRLNLGWLARHPVDWSGPNYFYANFFRVRALKFSDADGTQYARTMQRLFAQIKDHQGPDGSVGFPPGNAQNTVAMGPAFSTAMSVLILNVDRSRLAFDEDYRLEPLF